MIAAAPGPHQLTIVVQFGQLGDLPVPADWDGDGDIELGVWRPSTGRWYAQELDGTPVAIPSTPYGQAGDIPLAGNFTGSGAADQAVYRRQLGVLFIRDGANSATQTLTIGSEGIPGAARLERSRLSQADHVPAVERSSGASTRTRSSPSAASATSPRGRSDALRGGIDQQSCARPGLGR